MKDPLFGKYCEILTGYNKRPFIYRILASGTRSNAWRDVPLVGRNEPTNHGHDIEDVIFVVLDTLVNDMSSIIRVRKKDVSVIENGDYHEKRWIKPFESEDNNIHPCNGCEDFIEPNGCKSNGGCAEPPKEDEK